MVYHLLHLNAIPNILRHSFKGKPKGNGLATTGFLMQRHNDWRQPFRGAGPGPVPISGIEELNGQANIMDMAVSVKSSNSVSRSIGWTSTQATVRGLATAPATTDQAIALTLVESGATVSASPKASCYPGEIMINSAAASQGVKGYCAALKRANIVLTAEGSPPRARYVEGEAADCGDIVIKTAFDVDACAANTTSSQQRLEFKTMSSEQCQDYFFSKINAACKNLSLRTITFQNAFVDLDLNQAPSIPIRVGGSI